MTIIKNAHIKTVTGSIIPNGVLVIRDQKIKFIGETFNHLLEAEDVIDAKGCLVTPGLIDAHTHIGIDEEGVAWEGDDFNETSEPVTPHIRAIDGINTFDQGFQDALETGVTSIQVLPGSANVIGGLTACLKVKTGKTLEDLIILHPAGLKIALGENPKRLHGQAGRPPVTRMGVAGMLREQFTKAQNYMIKLEKNSIESDLRMEALVLALQRKIPVRVHAHRADDIMTAIRIGKEFNLKLSLEHVTEGAKIASKIRESKALVTIGPTLSSRSKVELKEISWTTYMALADERIPFAIITDHPVLPITHLTTSAQIAVREGLSNEAAWEALTINPAKILGIDNRVGSLEVGKDADLVIWDKDPVTENGRSLLTMVDGEIFFQSSFI